MASEWKDIALADGPIGAFDSGVGGLSVVRALLTHLPNEAVLYVADSAHCPYGPRGNEEIRRLSEGISRYLLAQGAKLIVIACNTASAAALGALRATFPQTRFVGMVPAVKPAVQLTRSGVVGVLATPTTIRGELYQEVVAHCGRGVRILEMPCPGLVERVEAGDLDGPETMSLLRACVEPMLQQGADTLVLGCTHYPFLVPALRRLVGDGVQLIEPSDAVARQTARVLDREGLRRQQPDPPMSIYATTGHAAHLARTLAHLGMSPGAVWSLRWENGVLCRVSAS